MPISQSRYIDITSGVGGGSPVPRRELIARLFTTNELVPTGGVVSFSNAEAVSTYFGAASEESSRATYYFGFVSKQVTSPQRIDFASWVSADAEPKIFGATGGQSVASYTGISDGSLVLTIGTTVLDLTGLDFSAASSLADVATVLQAGIRTGTGTVFTGATVAFDATRGSFNLVGGETGAATIAIDEGSAGTSVSALIGWDSLTAILSSGATAQEPVEAASDSAQVNNNFGSFTFMQGLSDDQITAVSSWNHTQNVVFQYHVSTLEADASDFFDALNGFSGTGLTLRGQSGEYHEMLPMAVLASTDFSRRAASQNYMFQRDARLTATASTDALADALDAVRTNYYGETQTAGQLRAFYQRGYLMGGANAPIDMGIFANEQWFKDAAAAELLTLLEVSPGVSASDIGRGQILGSVQSVIEQATINGTISAGRTLNTSTRQLITSLTGDENAFQQVETIGYWIDAQITSDTVNGIEEFTAQYTLIYARDTTIRKVEGSHILV